MRSGLLTAPTADAGQDWCMVTCSTRLDAFQAQSAAARPWLILGLVFNGCCMSRVNGALAGSEAGGHRGTWPRSGRYDDSMIGLASLVPQVWYSQPCESLPFGEPCCFCMVPTYRSAHDHTAPSSVSCEQACRLTCRHVCSWRHEHRTFMHF